MAAFAQSSRRSFLGALTAALGGAASASLATAAADPQPLDGPAPVSLAALDRRLRELIDQRDAAVQARRTAEDRFRALCPPRPLELIAPALPPDLQDGYVALEFNLGPALQNRGAGSEKRRVFDPELMAEDVALYPLSTSHGRWLAKRLRIAQRFNAQADLICAEVGYWEAAALEELAIREIKAVGQYIFSVEPGTLADVQTHARAIAAIAEEGHSGLWVYYGDPAPKACASFAASAVAVVTAARISNSETAEKPRKL